MCVYIYICMYVCVYIYIYIHTLPYRDIVDCHVNVRNHKNNSTTAMNDSESIREVSKGGVVWPTTRAN